ncbi:DUF4184 family protein [Nonomuraea africana]|uniref:DUF4184 family protein n=1 Tax=Nonomuraea africana TaxID=46171 RepID=A0ABR9KME2_9ACTN|nr:DUF4184 family protein [Nonomuraea africana]MBE1562722.1 hypothetical protein [Nonomuraea africana]
MPFTLSHVAAVVPLRRLTWLDPWALAVGAMVPDLPIFMPFLPDYDHWHSVRGVVTIDLLAALVLLAAFHAFLRLPLIALLPDRLAGRAATLTPSPKILPVVAGAAVGAATHVFWDSFTHSYASGVWGWAWLDHEVLGVIPVFRVLQYTSSALGLAFVIWWAWRALTRMADAPPPEGLSLSSGVRRAVLCAAALGAVAGAALWPVLDPPVPGIAGLVTRIGAGTLVGPVVVLALYAAIWQFRRIVAGFERA